MDISQERAIERLQELIDEVDSLKNSVAFSEAHTKWLTNALYLTEKVFGRRSRIYLNLANLPWHKTGEFLVDYCYTVEEANEEVRKVHHEAYLKSLDTAKGLLEAGIDITNAYGTDKVYEEEDTSKDVGEIITLIDLAQNKLRKTMRTMPKEEREVQDKFEDALISVDFKYLRDQETITYSSKSYKPDFTFPGIDTALEIKLCNRTGREKDIINVNVSENSTEISLPDTDGDGFSDWFEQNIAHYDPNIPNDRYIVIYYCFADDPQFDAAFADSYYKFFVKNAKVPPENITLLKKEEANATNLRRAIEEIASKSDKNDIVFLLLQGHGGGGWMEGSLEYTQLNEWLDQIEAKAVIITITACGCEVALPILKDGSCPRIVFVHFGQEFLSGLGEYQYVDPLPQGTTYEEMKQYFLQDCITVDTKHGNGDGYISLKEIADWADNDLKWASEGRSWVEAVGYSRVSDTSNISSQIYLTDYKIPS